MDARSRKTAGASRGCTGIAKTITCAINIKSGGTSSHDIDGGILEPDDPKLKRKCRSLNHRGVPYRVNHRSWWKEELPNDDEYRTAKANLEKCDWKVDYIVTHCGPTSVQDEVGGGFYKTDALTDFLEEVAERCQFKYWFFWTLP